MEGSKIAVILPTYNWYLLFGFKAVKGLSSIERGGKGFGSTCSNECKGSYVGNTVGFGGAGRGNRGAPRKWNYDRVYALQDERGWGCDRIGRELGIPSSTVSCILHRRRKNVQPNSYSTCL